MKPATKIKSALQFREQFTLQARQRGLDNLTKGIAARRNALGVKNKQLRARIEADMRENLDRADAFTKDARNALLAGDTVLYESRLKDARIEWLIALNKLKNPFAKKVDERNASNAEISKRARKYSVKPRSDLHNVIRACLTKNDRPRVIEWAKDYNLSRSTIYRDVEIIRKEFATECPNP